jgi:hypothetical protein
MMVGTVSGQRSGVDQSKLGDVEWTGQNIGRHIGNQGFVFRELLPLRAGDCFVGGNVQVGRTFGQVQFVNGGNAGRDFFAAVSGNIDVAEQFTFLDGFGSPCTGIGIVGRLAFAEQVHRDEGKLGGCPSGHEQHAVAFRNVEKFFDIGDGFVVHSGIFLAAVAHFHDGHAGVLVVDQFRLCLFEDLLRQRRRTR